MLITGYKFKTALQQHDVRLKGLRAEFAGSLVCFDSEIKRPPTVVFQDLQKYEEKIARLQTEQAKYNQVVRVTYGGQETTLLHAIKAVGGASRLEALLRKAAANPEGHNKHKLRSVERDTHKEYAKLRLSNEEATAMAIKAGKIAGEIRQAIYTGNSVEIEVENLEVALFE